MITGIVVALPEELSTLVSGKIEKGSCTTIIGDIVVAYSGAGPINAKKASTLLIAQGAKQLISWGCAAALSPELTPGNLVIPDKLLLQDHRPLSCNREWITHACRLLAADIKVKVGSLVASKTIVADSRDKMSIYDNTSALALDMESYAVAEAAAEAGLPCLVLRSIADPVKMSLPKAVVHALNSAGEIELTKLFRYTLMHPQEIPDLMKLGLHFAAARKTLKSVRHSLVKITEFTETDPKKIT